MKLKVKALSPKIGSEIPAPFYASAGAAAMDLHACMDEAVVIPAGKRAVIPTGIAIALHINFGVFSDGCSKDFSVTGS